MKSSGNLRVLTLLALTAFATGACSESATTPDVQEPAALLGVQPAGGAVNVSVGAHVVVTFNHAIADGMEDYVDLHEGSVTGPEVAGSWSLSQDQMVLTFTPAAPLKPATTYVIHIGGGMMDADGDHIDLEEHGMGMGGQWATESMMTSGGMGGGMMGGQTGYHMGSGWQDPSNGTYGMVFTFTTAG